jgi:hypothetical protein
MKYLVCFTHIASGKAWIEGYSRASRAKEAVSKWNELCFRYTEEGRTDAIMLQYLGESEAYYERKRTQSQSSCQTQSRHA